MDTPKRHHKALRAALATLGTLGHKLQSSPKVLTVGVALACMVVQGCIPTPSCGPLAPPEMPGRGEV